MPPSRLSDEELMQLFCAGDLSAFDVLYNVYHPMLLAYITRTLNPRHVSIAEDLTQDAFVNVIKFKRTFNPQAGGFKPWLYQIARRRQTSFFRSLTAAYRTLDAWVYMHPTNVTPTCEEERLVLEYLSYLSDEERVVIDLRYFEGFRCQEAASILGCPIGTVWGRCNSAVNKMKAVGLTQGRVLPEGLRRVAEGE
jgi:RNA polymerase sigma factor (sigma-70 family)